jgi:hypothetical protein
MNRSALLKLYRIFNPDFTLTAATALMDLEDFVDHFMLLKWENYSMSHRALPRGTDRQFIA